MNGFALILAVIIAYVLMLRGMIAVRQSVPRRWEKREDSPYQQGFSGARF
jgi:hypothetical protein